MHLFFNFASGRTILTQSTGPQPIQLVPKHSFLQISLYRSLKSKNFKNKVVLFSNFASGRTLPTQSTGPQPIQLVPKHLFLQISRYRSLKSKNFKKQGGFIFEFCFSEDPPHLVNWSPTHSTGPQTPEPLMAINARFMAFLGHFWPPWGPLGQFWWVQMAPTDHPGCIPPRSNQY